jgi:protein-L-isoaspartate(D-aspartate) O-methyltransferase
MGIEPKAVSGNDWLNNLIDEGYVRSDFAKAALGGFSRAQFETGKGAVPTPPVLAAKLLELLEPQPGDHVLEIGAGAGWLAAVLGYSVCPPTPTGSAPLACGCVLTLEENLSQMKIAKANLESAGVPESLVRVVYRDGFFGYKKEAPYNKMVSCVSVPEIPETWKEQLKVGGRLVVPVGDTLVVLEKTGKEAFKRQEFFGFRFPEMAMPKKDLSRLEATEEK